MKTCSRCGVSRSLEDFHRNRLRKDGRRAECKRCVRRYHDEHGDARRARARENYRARGRAQHRKRVYGLSSEDFSALLDQQGHACAVCAVDLDDESAIVDHDHDTGRIRGLLCRPCNSGIGHLRDDPGLVSAALAYLEREV